MKSPNAIKTNGKPLFFGAPDPAWGLLLGPRRETEKCRTRRLAQILNSPTEYGSEEPVSKGPQGPQNNGFPLVLIAFGDFMSFSH